MHPELVEIAERGLHNFVPRPFKSQANLFKQTACKLSRRLARGQMVERVQYYISYVKLACEPFRILNKLLNYTIIFFLVLRFAVEEDNDCISYRFLFLCIRNVLKGLGCGFKPPFFCVEHQKLHASFSNKWVQRVNY